ncbi:Bcr/CflA family efflux MFS transporter [Acetobacter oeni]|uniref:Bcr/CflA family efflux transporter n=1 Tax=Acetobacter oeni TaxID=304077 RepID=A0A511XIW7_9PROT|nr:Bcr/CflA family efflux MFS transporter [Acetobacter oeni]MBB3882630.1 DHA1 family bicyclomycin/chloramphenicol resistance-like MFS transporter [Acetobacter oeni]NHO18734.1 Bcr/CflA family efflux MFS transporter [Acetobacter oeni]GBR06641.1 major facilitator superfamily transporter [Acetobacter oeni LMG 21952]GEN62886.1 putative MFS-type transporter YdgK [Acetobacter oeni]
MHTVPTAPPATRRDLFLILCLLACLGPLNIDLYLPGFPGIAHDFHAGQTAVQFSLTGALLGLAAGQLAVGPFSDAKGRKGPLVIAMGLFTLSSLFCAAAPGIGTFIIARFMQGLTASAGLVLSRAIVRDVFSGTALARFFSRLMIITAIAPMVAPMIGGAILLAPSATWRTLFLFLAAVGLIASALTLLRLHETLDPSRRHVHSSRTTLGTFYSLFSDREFTGYALTVGLIHGGSFAYVAGTPFIYQTLYGVSPQVFSILFGINGLAMVAGSWLVGRASGPDSIRQILRYAVLTITTVSVLITVLGLIRGPLALLVIAIFLYMICIGIVLTSTFVLAIEHQGHRAGSASGLLGALPLLVGAIAAPLVGISHSAGAVPMGLVLLLTCLGGTVCCFRLAFHTPR